MNLQWAAHPDAALLQYKSEFALVRALKGLCVLAFFQAGCHDTNICAVITQVQETLHCNLVFPEALNSREKRC
jgi:hypothetical protein